MNSIAKRYRLGPISVLISGPCEVAEHVRSELAPVEDQSTCGPGVEFNFLNSPSGTLPPSWGAAEEGTLLAEHSGFRYSIARSQSGALKVDLVKSAQPRPTLTNLAARFRFFNWNFLSPSETLAKNFIYDIFDYICQIALVECGASFIHASAVEIDGSCLLISGLGGAGKSTTALNLVLSGRAKYLSDDLAILDQSGCVWRSPKKLQVYGYNVKGNRRATVSLLNTRTLPDKLAWHLRAFIVGNKRVRRRIRAEDLFGKSAVSKAAPLFCSVLLERTAVKKPELTEIAPETLAMNNTRILISELAPYAELASGWRLTGSRAPIPDTDALVTRTSLILRSAFGHAKSKHLAIPMDAEPALLLSAIENLAWPRNAVT
jgi:hypothetical protein